MDFQKFWGVGVRVATDLGFVGHGMAGREIMHNSEDEIVGPLLQVRSVQDRGPRGHRLLPSAPDAGQGLSSSVMLEDPAGMEL